MSCLLLIKHTMIMVNIMKKGKRIFPLVLLLLVFFAGLQNRKMAQVACDPVPTTGIDIRQSAILATSAEESSPTIEVIQEGENRITREYPELGIVINAQCPVTAAMDIPSLLAHTSDDSFHQMVQDFLLARYPQAEKNLEAEQHGEETWEAYGPESEILAVMSKFVDERMNGRIYFSDLAMNVNGGMGASDGSDHRYQYFTEQTPINSNSESFPLDDAITDATHALKPYTDFELVPYNVQYEEDSRTGRSWYRMGLQLSYQGTPVSVASNQGDVCVDIGITDTGIGYAQGYANLTQIEETGICHVMSLGEILTSFEEQGYSDLHTNSGDHIEVYWIQPEYFLEPGSTPGEYSLRPVWAFYYVIYSSVTPGYEFCNTLKLYADTGAICYS